jgi:hypothetical protein
MAARSSDAGQVGQATVEHLGLVVVVALLLAAVGAWAAAHVRAGAPPPVLERALAPLDAAPAIPDLGVAPGPGRSAPIGRALRGAARLGGRAGRLAAVGAAAFAGGFTGGLRATVAEFVRNPVAALRDGGVLARTAMTDPVTLGSAGLRAAIDYARELRAMPPEAAYRRVMRDLGEAGADVAVSKGKGLARRAFLRALRNRMAWAGGPVGP